jgi:hypothetical protein
MLQHLFPEGLHDTAETCNILQKHVSTDQLTRNHAWSYKAACQSKQHQLVRLNTEMFPAYEFYCENVCVHACSALLARALLCSLVNGASEAPKCRAAVAESNRHSSRSFIHAALEQSLFIAARRARNAFQTSSAGLGPVPEPIDNFRCAGAYSVSKVFDRLGAVHVADQAD